MAEPVDQRLPEHTEPEAQAAQQTCCLFLHSIAVLLTRICASGVTSPMRCDSRTSRERNRTRTRTRTRTTYLCLANSSWSRAT